MPGFMLEPKELDIINVVVKKEGLRGLFDASSKVLVDTDVFSRLLWIEEERARFVYSVHIYDDILITPSGLT